MSNAIEASLRLEITQYQQNLAKAKAEVAKFRDEMRATGGVSRSILGPDDTWVKHRANLAAFNKELGNLRGGGRMALGGAAMQVQDIAVQLQMGTKASIIFAQQGSQLLSMFGPGGMILGGLVAIGGAFITAGQAAQDGLAKGTAEAAALKREIQGILTTGGLPQMVAGLQKLSDLRSTFTSPDQGLKAYWTEVMAVAGGPTGDQKFAADQQKRMAEASMRQDLIRGILRAAQEEQRIAEARAAGNEKTAVSMERQLALSKELARIQSLNLPDEVKAALAQTATAQSGASALAASAQERKDAAARIAALRAETAQIAEGMLPDDQQLARLKTRLQSILGAAGPSGGVSSVGALGALANARQSETLLKDYREALNIQKEITALETAAADRAAARRKQQAAEIKQQLDQAQSKQEQADKEQAAQSRAKGELAAELQIDRLRAAGKKELADIETRRLQITREAYQIQQATGMSEQQSLALARERDQLRQQMQNTTGGAGSTKARQFTEADRQTGWTHPSTRAGKSRLMGGIDDWWSMQNSPSTWQRAQMQPSGWTQLQQRANGANPLQNRQQQNAEATQRRSEPTVNLGTKEIELFMQMKDALLGLLG